MTPAKIVNWFFIAVCISILGANLLSDFQSRFNTLRTGFVLYPFQIPYYGLVPVPGTATIGDSPGALGADFAQVYFSAKALSHGESAYVPNSPEFRDPLGRLPTYPPLTNHLYTPFAGLPYYKALWIHTFGSLALFLIVTAWVAVQLGIIRHLWKIVLADILLYFYTPLGCAHFERGQFDFFVAISYLCLFSYAFSQRRNWWTLILSGAAGAIKWSSFPFVGTYCLVAFAGTTGIRKWLYCLPILTILASMLLFYSELNSYWPSLRAFEFNAEPVGVTFMYFFPSLIAKNLQLLSAMAIALLLFVLRKKNGEIFRLICFPFALAMFIQGMCFGTVSYEYRIVSVLGLLPGFVAWIESTDVKPAIKLFTALLFGVFIVVACRTFNFIFFTRAEFHAVVMSGVYLAASIISLAICFYIAFLAARNEVHPDATKISHNPAPRT